MRVKSGYHRCARLSACAGLLAAVLFGCQGNGVAIAAGAGASTGDPLLQATAAAGTASQNGNALAGTDTSGTGVSANPHSSGNPNSTTSGVAGSPGVAANYLFGPYKDTSLAIDAAGTLSTAVTGKALPVLEAAPMLTSLTWAFATGVCGQESWSGVSADALVKANVPLFVAANKGYIVATGGAGGTFTCASDAGFQAFLDRYASASFLGVDFDIEAGQSKADIADLVARVKAAEANPKYAKLRFSFTIATVAGTGGQGLADQGESVVLAIQAAKLPDYLINLMVMDYGSADPSICVVGTSGLCDMGKSAIQAAKNLQAKYAIAYANMELTPMIGGNDTVGETFALADVAPMMAFVRAQGIRGVHYWSLDRDRDCLDKVASDSCNSVGNAKTLGYLQAFLAPAAL